jgi:hypothetical protein
MGNLIFLAPPQALAVLSEKEKDFKEENMTDKILCSMLLS